MTETPATLAARFVRVPLTGDKIRTRSYGVVTVTDVRQAGRIVAVKDSRGRHHVATRSDRGVWVRA